MAGSTSDPHSNADLGMCQEQAGFLFSHRCGSMAVRECANCQKSICQKHSLIDEVARIICVACAKKTSQTSSSTTAPGKTNRPTRTSDYDSDWDREPYFYRDRYYTRTESEPPPSPAAAVVVPLVAPTQPDKASAGGKDSDSAEDDHREQDSDDHAGSEPDHEQDADVDDFHDGDEAALMGGMSDSADDFEADDDQTPDLDDDQDDDASDDASDDSSDSADDGSFEDDMGAS